MAVAKRQQGSPIFLTLVIFIVLFVIATVFSVIYYIKYDEQTSNLETAKNELYRWVGSSEQFARINEIVGTIPADKSATEVLTGFITELVTKISGRPLPESSAEVKTKTAENAVRDLARPYFVKYVTDTNDPNSLSLSRVVKLLGEKLDNLTQQNIDLDNKYSQLFVQLDTVNKAHKKTVDSLTGQLKIYQDQVEDINSKYRDTEITLRQTTDQQVQNASSRAKLAEAKQSELQQELEKTQAVLASMQERMNKVLAQLESIKPLPDSNALAYMADGRVILYDSQTKIVHINLGSDDGVYRGLTFGVYDKDLPIPKDGKGKAEIEVYDVDKTISTARLITPVNLRNPIIKDDIIANLVWNKNQKYHFVVAGEFEQYGDAEKIKALILKMGGILEDSVTVNTDFLVLGSAPFVLVRPTPEQIDLNPAVLEKYEASRKIYDHYRQIEQDARTFSIPVFNIDRFLLFTGYKEQISKPGAL